MQSLVVILLCVWIIPFSEVFPVSLPDITDRKFIDECVSEHNKARSSVSPPANNMLSMTWDEDLAIMARTWARQCVFKHSPKPRVHPTFSYVGENLWAGSPLSSFDTTNAIKKWVDEKLHYNYNSNVCTKVCGHYTQVVWARSLKVGCATELCPNGVKDTTFADKEGVIFVCNYGPGGNINGRRPYESRGRACSGCNGTCVDNLCSDTSNWDSNSSFVPVLIVRPIGLIITFTLAYAVHHFYPDVFCYE